MISSAVDVESGVYTSFDWDNLKQDEYVTAVLASASFPFAFPMTELRGRYYMDGGTTWNTNIISAIDKCKQLGYKEEEIVLDIMQLDPMSIEPWHPTSNQTNTWNYYMRAQGLKSNYQSLNDLAEFIHANPKLNYRYLVIPSKSLMADWQMLYPNPTLNAAVIEQGKEDAQAALAMGEGGSFKKFLANFPWAKI